MLLYVDRIVTTTRKITWDVHIMHRPASWTMMMTSSDLPAASVLVEVTHMTALLRKHTLMVVRSRWFRREAYNAFRQPRLLSMVLSY